MPASSASAWSPRQRTTRSTTGTSSRRAHGATRGYRELFSGAEDEPHEAWVSRLHEDDRPRVKTALREALDGESEHWLAEYRMRRPDGTVANVVDRGWILRDDSGRGHTSHRRHDRHYRARPGGGACSPASDRVGASRTVVNYGRDGCGPGPRAKPAARRHRRIREGMHAPHPWRNRCAPRIAGTHRANSRAGRASRSHHPSYSVESSPSAEPDYSAIKVDELLRESVELADYDAARVRCGSNSTSPPTCLRSRAVACSFNRCSSTCSATPRTRWPTMDPDNRNISHSVWGWPIQGSSR